MALNHSATIDSKNDRQTFQYSQYHQKCSIFLYSSASPDFSISFSSISPSPSPSTAGCPSSPSLPFPSNLPFSFDLDFLFILCLHLLYLISKTPLKSGSGVSDLISQGSTFSSFIWSRFQGMALMQVFQWSNILLFGVRGGSSFSIFSLNSPPTLFFDLILTIRSPSFPLMARLYQWLLRLSIRYNPPKKATITASQMAQAELSSYFFVCFSAWTIAKVAMIVATPSMYIIRDWASKEKQNRVQGGKQS